MVVIIYSTGVIYHPIAGTLLASFKLSKPWMVMKNKSRN